MRRLAPLLLVLAACSEPAAVKVTPLDRFAFPASLALLDRQAGGQALLVASGNYDLTYDAKTGGTLLSVDPRLAADGGSAIAGGGALVKFGEGEHVASYAGQLALVDGSTCPGVTAPQVLLATRYADQIWRLPVGVNGEVAPCQGDRCAFAVDNRLKDPFGVALACRPDGQRRSAFVSYLRVAEVGGVSQGGWLAEIDLDDPASPTRVVPVGSAVMSGMAYDEVTDQLYVVGQPLLSAPIYILDLAPCGGVALAACALPGISVFDLSFVMPGLELQAIAFSNRQAGLGRRAYVSARVYDATLAALIGARPAADVSGVLLVLDLEPDLTGHASFQVLNIVETGLGASQLQVLPARAPSAAAPTTPRRDVVAVTSITDGMLTVYDDDTGDVVRVIPIDATTGAPEVGRNPFGMAAVKIPGATPADDVARIYVAASREQVVSIVDVPLDAPGQAHLLEDASGAAIRIGGLQ